MKFKDQSQITYLTENKLDLDPTYKYITKQVIDDKVIISVSNLHNEAIIITKEDNIINTRKYFKFKNLKFKQVSDYYYVYKNKDSQLEITVEYDSYTSSWEALLDNKLIDFKYATAKTRRGALKKLVKKINILSNKYAEINNLLQFGA